MQDMRHFFNGIYAVEISTLDPDIALIFKTSTWI